MNSNSKTSSSLVDDPKLTAWVLGELDEASSKQVEQELSQNPEVHAEVEKIAALSVELGSGLEQFCPAHTFSAAQRQQILASARNGKAVRIQEKTPHATLISSTMWIGLGGAVAAAFTLLAVLHNWSNPERQTEIIGDASNRQGIEEDHTLELMPVRFVGERGSESLLLTSSLRPQENQKGWVELEEIQLFERSQNNEEFVWAEARPVRWPSSQYSENLVVHSQQVEQWLPRVDQVPGGENQVRVEDGPCPWNRGQRLLQLEFWLPKGEATGNFSLALSKENAQQVRLLHCFGEERKQGALWTVLCSYEPVVAGNIAEKIQVHCSLGDLENAREWNWLVEQERAYYELEQCSGLFLVQAALAGWQLRETGELIPDSLQNQHLVYLLDTGVEDDEARAKLNLLMGLKKNE